jgi:hypothetical protein
MNRTTMSTYKWLVAIALAFATPFCARAALVITEVQPQTTSGTASTINGDWWELTNSGPGSIDLGGYAWADTEDDLFGADPSPNIFPSFMISAGQSIIILDEPSANEAAWRTNWGLDPSVEILSAGDMLDIPPDGDTFSGLSDSNDAVYLYTYDPMDLLATTLVSSYSWVANTRGTTFEASIGGTDLGLSVVDRNGAVLAANGDIGSPGTAVPEPTTVLMILTGAVAAMFSRRVH